MKEFIKNSNVFYRYINANFSQDFYAISVGCERCDSHKIIQGPVVKNHFIIHYVVSGKGHFIVDKKKYSVGANDFFFISPDTKITYYQDSDEPWSYYWFEYSGNTAETLSAKCHFTASEPIYHSDDPEFVRLFSQMLRNVKGASDSLVATAYIYLIFNKLIDLREPKLPPRYTKKELLLEDIYNYIANNYNNSDMSLSLLSDFFHLTPCYISSVFKSVSGVSFSKYLTDYRIRKAHELMVGRPDLKIKSIAYSVGYSDPLYFSKVFKKYCGIAPSNYVFDSDEE